jgi:hypothetical protein
MPGSDFDNVPQWFQIPATEKPGFFALRSGMERLTYAGLDAWTDALRDRLTGAAIAKGARAGRTLYHHILPGGAGSRGAFVPLDPSGRQINGLRGERDSIKKLKQRVAHDIKKIEK